MPTFDNGEALLAANPGLSEELLAGCLARWWDVRDDDGPGRIDGYACPEPGEAHPVGAGAQARKIAQAQAEASVPVHAFAHGYGLPDDMAVRIATATWMTPSWICWAHCRVESEYPLGGRT